MFLLLLFCRGNTIIVGALGQQLTSLTLLALFLAGYDHQSLDITSVAGCTEGMKAVLRQAGLGGRAGGGGGRAGGVRRGEVYWVCFGYTEH